MKYMLLIYHDENSFMSVTEAERQEMYLDYRKLREELTAKGKFLDGSQLQPAMNANTIRVRNGRSMTTDGPFAETREQIGGFFLIEAKDLDEANNIASRIPSARMGAIEIRPVVESADPTSA